MMKGMEKKEYERFDNKLIYEGEYLNGEKNGKIKLNDPKNRQLIFEGEFSKGEIKGNIKEYDFLGNLTFEGENLKGKKMEKERTIV